jgi:hypothetical protein
MNKSDIKLKNKVITFVLAVMLTLSLSFLTVSKQQLMIMKDDANFTSVRDNLAGVSNRQKARLRWYGFEDISPRLCFIKKGVVGSIGLYWK